MKYPLNIIKVDSLEAISIFLKIHEMIITERKPTKQKKANETLKVSFETSALSKLPTNQATQKNENIMVQKKEVITFFRDNDLYGTEK